MIISPNTTLWYHTASLLLLFSKCIYPYFWSAFQNTAFQAKRPASVKWWNINLFFLAAHHKSCATMVKFMRCLSLYHASLELVEHNKWPARGHALARHSNQIVYNLCADSNVLWIMKWLWYEHKKVILRNF